MTVIFSWLVYGRYVLNSTPTWVEQVSLLLVVLIGFLGAAIGIHKKTHLGVSYFRDRMPRFLQIFFDLVTHLMLIIFGYVMMIYSYKLAVFKWTTQIPLIHIPEGLRAVPIMIWVCPKFFRHKNFNSFTRLLNMYQFHKVPGSGRTTTNPAPSFDDANLKMMQRGQ